jgi:RNA polymerase sigma-70 factor, ECF subfamily
VTGIARLGGSALTMTTSSFASAAERAAGMTVPIDWPALIAHRGFLVRFARRKLHDPSLAEDLVHDVFEAVMTNRARFAGRSSLRGWLVGVLEHKLVDLIRDRVRHPSLEAMADVHGEHVEPWIEWASPEPGPEQIAEHRQRLRHTLARIARLPKRLRRVVELRLLHEQPTAEVCNVLQITPDNLFVCLHRARRELARHVGMTAG